jgi:hypothetical protein
MDITGSKGGAGNNRRQDAFGVKDIIRRSEQGKVPCPWSISYKGKLLDLAKFGFVEEIHYIFRWHKASIASILAFEVWAMNIAMKRQLRVLDCASPGYRSLTGVPVRARY